VFAYFHPDDYTRIILPEINGIDGSDYINGNYIKVGNTK
jgi:protein tyrosine phosphatase